MTTMRGVWTKSHRQALVQTGRFGGYNLGYTGGSNTDADNHAIKRAATEQEVHKAKSRLQKKRAVAKVLNIDTKCWSYRGSTFKQQWDKFLPPTANYDLYGLC